MTTLTNKKCIPCEGGVQSLSLEKAKELLEHVKNWQLSNSNEEIQRDFKFQNFYQTIAFINAVAFIANQENHHPNLKVGYNHCHISYSTHAINGLSENDFICAAKINALLNL